MEGWIKLHRSVLKHWLYTEYRPLTRREAWETILFTVNYEPSKMIIKGQLYDCNRGQSLLSLNSWAEKFVWSIKQVRTFFDLLEKDEMIKVEGLQYTTRLTVCNYDIYQDNGHTKGTPRAHQRHTKGTPRATIKEGEEIKENKELKEYEFEFLIDDRFKTVFINWLEYKKNRKECYKTPQSIEACYNKLVNLSIGNPEIAKKIINESFANNWSGFFKLKDEKEIKEQRIYTNGLNGLVP